MLEIAASCVETSCRYRGDRGYRCVIGSMIADEHYTPDLEGNGVGEYDPVARAIVRSGTKPDDQGWMLLGDLQNVHDAWIPSAWPDKLRSLAVVHGLSTAVLDEATP